MGAHKLDLSKTRSVNSDSEILYRRGMKINFQFVTVLSSVGINLVAANCNTNDLTQPDNFKDWKCNLPVGPGGTVIAGTRCELECEEGFTPYSDRKRKHYVCRNINVQHPNGWRPNELNLQCKYDRK